MSDGTEKLIERIHESRKKHSIVINPSYLDDEKLSEIERSMVLREIFNKNIREKQLSRIIRHLPPILDHAHPPSALIFGPTGSGKTVSSIHILSVFAKVAAKKGVKFSYRYIDMTSGSTHFGALNEIAISIGATNRRYKKGIPIEFIKSRIEHVLSNYGGFLCLLIDEIDNIKPLDMFLTYLIKTLPRKIPCRLILLMVTNRLDIEKSLDPRILSFLKKNDIKFESYDALDLLEILKLRAKKALQIEKVDSAALKKIAALSSKETGDARKAVELLAKSVEIAEESSGFLGLSEVDLAEASLEIDKTVEMINALATQQKIALLACYYLFKTQCHKVNDRVYNSCNVHVY